MATHNAFDFIIYWAIECLGIYLFLTQKYSPITTMGSSEINRSDLLSGGFIIEKRSQVDNSHARMQQKIASFRYAYRF